MSERTREQGVSATFPPHPHSVRMARALVCDEVRKIGGRAMSDVAALAATELVTNVVLHARTDFTVSVCPLSNGRVRVSVSDGSTVLPVPQTPRANSALGRGLRLVEQVADAWGAELVDANDEAGPGKTVWFELGPDGRRAAGTSATYQSSVTELLTVPRVPLESLVDVRLVGMPLQLFAREWARHRELMREMALIAFGDDRSSDHVPAALTLL